MDASPARDPVEAQRAADDALLAAVVRESRRVRALRLGAALLPGAVLALAAATFGLRWAVPGAALALLGLVWQARVLGPLPRGRLSLFDGAHPLDHVTFTGLWIYVGCSGRRSRLFGPAAASPAFRQVLRRKWPDMPHFVSVLPLAD
ncbi:MAG: hypothetical protein U1A78_21030 [Polyangia bacterium]